MATFTGTGGADTFLGGDGIADTFVFAPANLSLADTVIGGTGTAIDTLQLTAAGTVTAAALANVSGLERVILAAGTNSFTISAALGSGSGAASGAFTVAGSSGSDVVDASAVTAAGRVAFALGAGNDTFTGSAGSDFVHVDIAQFTASDVLFGGANTAAGDVLQINQAGAIAAARFAGISGFERVILANGNNSVGMTDAVLAANGGLLTIAGNAGADFINGGGLTGTNRLVLTAGLGNDTLLGGAGGDTFQVGGNDLDGSDRFSGGAGAAVDTLQLLTAGVVLGADTAQVTGIERIILANGTNTLTVTSALATGVGVAGTALTVIGGSGRDFVEASPVGSAGRVLFSPGGGSDTFNGGAGNDIVLINPADLGVEDVLNGGASGSVGDNLMFTATDAIKASAFSGVSGFERVTLAAGTSSLTLPNALVASASGATVTVSGGTGITVDAQDVAAPNRVVVVGSTAVDLVTGGAGNDQLDGRGGADTLAGGDGNDTLLSNAATSFADDATFLGGAGNDRLEYNVGSVLGVTPLISGGSNSDTLFDTANRSATINLALVSSDQTSGDIADVRSFENVDWSQSSGSITVSGSTGANTILGGAGFDRIDGRGGADLLDGGANRDVLVGSGTAIAIVDLSAAGGDQTLADAAIVRNFEAVDWSASSGSLIATGTANEDILIGGSATDSLTGGLGADTLTGGGAADVFISLVRTTTTDVVTDFTPGTDKFQFAASAFDFNGETFNVTVTTTSSSTFSVAGADLIRLTDAVADAAAVSTYLSNNGTGTDGEGVFVIAQVGGGNSFLYHVADAGNPVDIVRIADLGPMAANTISTTDFVFV